jgi:hypothetical protein
MKNQHTSFSITHIDFSTFQMKSSKEFCFVCNEPVFFSNRQHLQNHMQKKHQEIYEIILKSNLLKSDDIVSFPGIPCGLVKICFAFPLEFEGRQATLVLGHRICQKMDCATKWIDNEGNLLFVWTLLFDHDRKEDMSILQAWPNDEKNRSLLANDQPTMICAIHMPQHIKSELFDTGSLPSVPIDQEAKDAYWRYSGRSKITRDTVTKQFFKGFNIFKLLAEPMETAKKECSSKSMPKRLKSVVNVGPFVVEQNAFKIKVLLLDPMVKKQKNKTYYCYSYYKDQRSDKTKLKAKNATAQWKKEKEKEEIKMTDCTSSKYKDQQSDKTKLKSKTKSLQLEKEKQKEEGKIRVGTSREYNDHHKKSKTKLKAKSKTVQWDKENKENKMKAFPISFEAVVRIRRLSESEINFHAENESLECMRSKSKKRIQSISSVVDSHNSDAANLETDSESDAKNESLECTRTLSSIQCLQPSSQVISSSSFETVVDSHNSDAATLETESESDFNLDADNESMNQQPALDYQVVNSMEKQQFTNIINKAREMQDHAARSREGPAEASAATTTKKKKCNAKFSVPVKKKDPKSKADKLMQSISSMCAKGDSDHHPPSQVISSTEQQQQQQQQQIVNLTNKVNEMQAIMRRLETQKPALDSQVFYPTEHQQQEQQQKPQLSFHRGCPYCPSYLVSTREEMDKHIDDCRTIFHQSRLSLQQPDQKPVVKKEEHKDNLDIAQNDEDPSVDSFVDEADSYFPLPHPCGFCKFIANSFEEYYTHSTTSHPEMFRSESSDTDILQIPIVTLTDDSDHHPPSQVISSTEQQQQQQPQQIVNLTNKVNEMQAIMRRLETQKPALDSQVFYPTEHQQQEQQQKPQLSFHRGCPYCPSYLVSTREEMDKHIDDCRTIFHQSRLSLQQPDQKPVVKKEEHKDNLDIAQNDEDPSVDSFVDEADSYFPLPHPCGFCKFIANSFEEYYTHSTTSHPEMFRSESSDTDILQIPIVTLTDDSDDSDNSDEKSMPSTSLQQHNSADSKSKSANSESTNVNMQQQEKQVKEKKKTGNLKRRRRRQEQQQQSESSFKKQKK